jgi:hypothetical protein
VHRTKAVCEEDECQVGGAVISPVIKREGKKHGIEIDSLPLATHWPVGCHTSLISHGAKRHT